MRVVAHCMFIIALFFSFTGTLSSQVFVSGSGTPEADGLYIHDWDYNGKPAYTSASGPTRLIFWSSPQWRITNNGGYTYYVCNSSADLPPAAGWAAGDIGALPAPALSPGGVQPSGSGTSEDPYLIGSLGNLIWIAAPDAQVPSPNRAARWAAEYQQTADIDAGVTGGGEYWGAGWTPIGTTGTRFTGYYQGGGHTINGLTIDRPGENDQGLFGAGGAGVISYLTLTSLSISGNTHVGGIVGDAAGTVVTFSSTSGSVSAGGDAGGIAGYTSASAVFEYCSSSVAVNATNQAAGGLIGRAHASSVAGCTATGNVDGYEYAGGLIGYTWNTGIAECSASGSVDGYNPVGGLIGITYSANIAKCYSTGAVAGYMNIGGLVGILNGGSVTNCYSRSAAGTSYAIGGLVGQIASDPTITNSYSIGAVSGLGMLGGLIAADNGGTVSGCYWDTQTSGRSSSARGTGKTTAEMKTQSTFTGWDFVSTWEIVPGNYPRLIDNPDGALPVELLSFTASAKGRGVELAWKTASELNNKGFEIQRTELNHRNIGSLNQSTDESMNQWHGIGFIAGHGTTNAPQSYTFVDNSVFGTVSYRLKQVNNDGSFTYSSAVEVTVAAPSAYALSQNHPNPFNPATTISYSLPAAGFVTLKVYDILGKEVATLVNGMQESGANKASFDASQLPSGIYFARLSSGSFSSVIKMTLMK
ncbi:MAG: T9SS type A sorting domain-containing protein [Bacteroidetes bacterium]|nr:MAG: T9SS type A sorting domain-containing protein [Bacteroidota bacterium]